MADIEADLALVGLDALFHADASDHAEDILSIDLPQSIFASPITAEMELILL